MNNSEFAALNLLRPAGQPQPGLSADDPDPGPEPAPGARRQRFDRQGENRAVRPRPSAWVCWQAGRQPAGRAGAGALSDPRAGGSGGHRDPPSCPYPAQRQAGDPVRRHPRPHRNPPPWALALTSPSAPWAGSKHLERGPLSSTTLKDAGAGRSGSHAGHGLCEEINRVISHALRDRQTCSFRHLSEGIAQMSRGVQHIRWR